MGPSGAALPAVDLSEDKGPLILRSIYPLVAVATLAVAARFTSRKLNKVQWALDDYATLVCLALTWGVIISTHFCVIYRAGRHIDVVSVRDQFLFLKAIYALNEIYIATTPSIKVAALLMYRRIFITPKFQMAVNVFLAVVTSWWLAEAIAAVFLCIPINGFWDKTVQAKCMSLRSFDLSFAIINICLDFSILFLPVNMVWRLQIRTVHRIALTFVFLLGGLACIIAIVRLLSAILQIDNPDFTWGIGNTLIWTAAECSVGCISVCLPTLRPLISAVFGKGFSVHGSDRLKKSHTHENSDNWPTDNSFTRLKDGNVPIHAGNSVVPPKAEITGERRDPNAHPYDIEHGIKVTTELELHELNKKNSL